MFLTKSKYSVSIKVDNDKIYLNGSASEAENAKLKGVIEVTSSPEICPSSPVTIHLSLNCNLKIKSKALFSVSHNQILFRLNWNFKCHFDFSQSSNNIKFPFTAKLPGDLPASVDLDDFKISYQFKAYEEGPLIQSKTTLATKQIFIHRLAHISSPQYTFIHANSPAPITKLKGEIIPDQALYTLKYPKIWYDLEKAMSIQLSLNLLPSQRVHSIIYSIKQSLTLTKIQSSDFSSKFNYNYQLSTQNAYTLPFTKFKANYNSAAINQDYSNSINESGYINFKLTTEVNPFTLNQKKFANFTSINNEFKVEHYLLTQVTILDLSNNSLKREIIRVPLTFLPKPEFNFSCNNGLPSYEEAISR